MAWYDQLNASGAYVHDFASSWTNWYADTPAERKGSVAKLLRENTATQLVTKLSQSNPILGKIAAANPGLFASAFKTALANNEQFTNLLTGIPGAGGSAASAAAKQKQFFDALSGSQTLLTKPWMAQAFTDALTKVGTTGYNMDNLNTDLADAAAKKLQGHLSTLGNPNDVLTELTDATTGMASLTGQTLSGNTKEILDYLGTAGQTDGINRGLRDAILTRIQKDPNFLPEIMKGGGGTGLTVKDLKELEANPKRMSAVISVLGDLAQDATKANIESAVRTQLVDDSKRAAASFNGRTGDVLFNAMKTSAHLFADQAARDAFFDRFEITNAYKAEIFRAQGLHFNPSNGQVRALKDSEIDALPASVDTAAIKKARDAFNAMDSAKQDALIATTRADIVELTSDADALKSAFIAAAEKNPAFLSSLILASHESPETLDKLFKNPTGLNIADRFGIGTNILNYLAKNPDLDFEKLLDGFSGISNLDFENMDYGEILETLRDLNFDETGKHVFGLTDAIIQDNKGELKDLWNQGVDVYFNFFKEIQESIMNSNMSPEMKQLWSGIFKMIEQIIPQMLEGLGLIANLGGAIASEIGRATMVSADPLANGGLMTGGQQLNIKQYRNFVAQAVEDSITQARGGGGEPVSQTEPILIKGGDGVTRETTLRDIRHKMSYEDLKETFGVDALVTKKPGSSLRSRFKVSAVDFEAPDDGQPTEVTIEAPDAGEEFRASAMPSKHQPHDPRRSTRPPVTGRPATQPQRPPAQNGAPIRWGN